MQGTLTILCLKSKLKEKTASTKSCWGTEAKACG